MKDQPHNTEDITCNRCKLQTQITVFSSMGSLAIGGNHTIHGCRRNIDRTLMLSTINLWFNKLSTSPTTPRGFWTVSQKAGNIDPTFDGCKLPEASGATFVARENVTAPKKLEKVIREPIAHKGFSFVEPVSNCHINLGRKNKIQSAMANLDWIDSITMPKKKWDALPEEEKINYIPTGILKQVQEPEYCEMYEEIKKVHQGKRGKITPDEFTKKI